MKQLVVELEVPKNKPFKVECALSLHVRREQLEWSCAAGAASAKKFPKEPVVWQRFKHGIKHCGLRNRKKSCELNQTLLRFHWFHHARSQVEKPRSWESNKWES
jgi:hypothetical protein